MPIGHGVLTARRCRGKHPKEIIFRIGDTVEARGGRGGLLQLAEELGCRALGCAVLEVEDWIPYVSDYNLRGEIIHQVQQRI